MRSSREEISSSARVRDETLKLDFQGLGGPPRRAGRPRRPYRSNRAMVRKAELELVGVIV